MDERDAEMIQTGICLGAMLSANATIARTLTADDTVDGLPLDVARLIDDFVGHDLKSFTKHARAIGLELKGRTLIQASLDVVEGRAKRRVSKRTRGISPEKLVKELIEKWSKQLGVNDESKSDQ